MLTKTQKEKIKYICDRQDLHETILARRVLHAVLEKSRVSVNEILKEYYDEQRFKYYPMPKKAKTSQNQNR